MPFGDSRFSPSDSNGNITIKHYVNKGHVSCTASEKKLKMMKYAVFVSKPKKKIIKDWLLLNILAEHSKIPLEQLVLTSKIFDIRSSGKTTKTANRETFSLK